MASQCCNSTSNWASISKGAIALDDETYVAAQRLPFRAAAPGLLPIEQRAPACSRTPHTPSALCLKVSCLCHTYCTLCHRSRCHVGPPCPVPSSGYCRSPPPRCCAWCKMNDRETNAELTWPESSGPVNAQLDSAASCSICNDFYDTPLVLPCGHSCKSSWSLIVVQL